MKRRYFHKIIILLAFAGGIFTTSIPVADAATWYISPTGNDTSGNGNSGSPYKTLSKASSVGAAGDTYILKNGTYNYSGIEISNAKSGTAGNYTIVKAENDGGAVFTSSGSCNLTNTIYVRFEGLAFKIPGEQKNFDGSGTHHVKFLRCAFQGGGGQQNVMNTVVSNGAHHYLFEDCWFFGLGGRYQLLIYFADYVVVRRCVFRVDGGWSEGGQANPQAAVNAYSSNYVAFQNCILIDSPASNYASSQDRNGFYQTTDKNVTDVSYEGCIALNGAYAAFNMDPKSSNTVSNLTFKDIVAWGYGMGIVSKVSASVVRATIGGIPEYWLASWSGTITASYSVITHTSAIGLTSTNLTFSDTWPNAISGTNNRNVNPVSTGLTYPVRVESGSYLATNQAGGRMGANIVNRIGASGTLYGDTNWNVDTGESLWPWPGEARIKVDMSQVSTLGFCASGTSLTKYIWQYLGNAAPPEFLRVPTAPGGVLVQ